MDRPLGLTFATYGHSADAEEATLCTTANDALEDVVMGHERPIPRSPRDVRLSPESDRLLCCREMTLWANSRHQSLSLFSMWVLTATRLRQRGYRSFFQ